MDNLNNDECGFWNKLRVCQVPLVKLEELSVFCRRTIPADYLDIMGHMNIRWYMALFSDAARKFFASFGMAEKYYRENHTGSFALKHYIQYLAEVRVGETVAVRTRALGRSEKRFYFMHFMINETNGKLASIMEGLATHADLKLRRASQIPADIAEKFDAILDDHQQLDWQAPVCGAIQI